MAFCIHTVYRSIGVPIYRRGGEERRGEYVYTYVQADSSAEGNESRLAILSDLHLARGGGERLVGGWGCWGGGAHYLHYLHLPALPT